MKNITLLFTLTIVCNCHAQTNLVPNGSFEEYTSCPSTLNQVDSVVNWFPITESPDYYNTCAVNSVATVPSNEFGYQNAHSGNAYCGMFCYYPNNGREYIGTQLIQPLTTGQKYFITYWLSLSSSTPQGATGVGTNKFGLKLSNYPFVYNSLQPDNEAYFYSDSIVSDTSNWIKIYGSFIADSAYNYIAFGNFFDNVNTDTAAISNTNNTNIAYYYIDDICLSTDSLCSIHDAIEVVNIISGFQITPNPAKTLFTLTSYNMIIECKVCNAIGQLVLVRNHLDTKQTELDASQWSAGIYFLTVQIGYETFSKKLIVQ